MRVAPASRRHLSSFCLWLANISSIKQAILAFEKKHSLKQTPGKIPIENWAICILRVLLSKLRLNIHRLTSVAVDECHGTSPFVQEPRHKCWHWHIQGAPQFWRPYNKVVEQRQNAPKCNIEMNRVSIWEVTRQENTSRPLIQTRVVRFQGTRTPR